MQSSQRSFRRSLSLRHQGHHNCNAMVGYILTNNFMVLSIFGIGEIVHYNWASAINLWLLNPAKDRLAGTHFSERRRKPGLGLGGAHRTRLIQKALHWKNTEWIKIQPCLSAKTNCLPPFPCLPADSSPVDEEFSAEPRIICSNCLPCPSLENPLAQTSMTLEIRFMTCNIKWLALWGV